MSGWLGIYSWCSSGGWMERTKKDERYSSNRNVINKEKCVAGYAIKMLEIYVTFVVLFSC